jgi:hypothetical protein
MKLSYRGISYDYTPPEVEVSTSETVGKYRGLDVRFRNPKKPLVLNTNLDLVYRGVAHNPGQAASQPAPAPAPEVETAPVVATVTEPIQAVASSVSDKARALMMNHDRRIKRRQQAMLTRLDAEVGVDTAEAARYWNRVQGKVHPSFRATYDRSSVAFS